jgi:Lrp/AsnC family transcriptional regulator, leucine-responsive regulatory protein
MRPHFESRALDALDQQLLQLLQLDGRMPHAGLARRVGRSRSAVQERISRLERLGYIGGYTIRRGRAGAPVRAYLLVTTASPDEAQLAAALDAFPSVRVCDAVSGELSLVLEVETSDIETVDAVRATVAAVPGVVRTQTAVVLQNRFDRR